MPEVRGSVPGEHDAHKVTFYGLSTCIWCKKTRQFLEEHSIAFDYVYVDLLHGKEREEALEKVAQWNPAKSFPTVVVGDQAVIGYKTQKIKEALRL